MQLTGVAIGGQQQAEDALSLNIQVRSCHLGLELAVQERRVQQRHDGW